MSASLPINKTYRIDFYFTHMPIRFYIISWFENKLEWKSQTKEFTINECLIFLLNHRHIKPVVLKKKFHRAALCSKCKFHGPHACHLHITSSIQTNQIYNIIYRSFQQFVPTAAKSDCKGSTGSVVFSRWLSKWRGSVSGAHLCVLDSDRIGWLWWPWNKKETD